MSVDDERVQELLKRVCGMDMDVVFTPRKEPLIPPRYQLMTRDQLNEVIIMALSSVPSLPLSLSSYLLPSLSVELTSE